MGEIFFKLRQSLIGLRSVYFQIDDNGLRYIGVYLEQRGRRFEVFFTAGRRRLFLELERNMTSVEAFVFALLELLTLVFEVVLGGRSLQQFFEHLGALDIQRNMLLALKLSTVVGCEQVPELLEGRMKSNGYYYIFFLEFLISKLLLANIIVFSFIFFIIWLDALVKFPPMMKSPFELDVKTSYMFSETLHDIYIN